MGKNIKKINESQLRKIVSDSLKDALSEGNGFFRNIFKRNGIGTEYNKDEKSAQYNKNGVDDKKITNGEVYTKRNPDNYPYQGDLPYKSDNDYDYYDGYRIKKTFDAPSEEVLFEEAYDSIERVAQWYAWDHKEDFLVTHQLHISKTMVFNAMHNWGLSGTGKYAESYTEYLDNNAEHIKDIIGKAWRKWVQDGRLEGIILQAETDYEVDNGHPFEPQKEEDTEDYLTETKLQKIISESIKDLFVQKRQ